jgi:hypothetical protein
MRIHPVARWLLIGGALAIASAAPLHSLLPCLSIIIITYVLLGEGRSLATYVVMVAPFVLVAAALWIFVYTDLTRIDLAVATEKLLLPDSNFAALVRTLTGTSLLYLALTAVPDGEIYPVLRRMGLPQTVAFVFASGFALISTVRDSFEHAILALRAQGILTASFSSGFCNLGRIVSLTWLTGLSITASRAETKWAGNQFIEQLEQRVSMTSSSWWDSTISTLSVLCILVLLFFTALRNIYGHIAV